MSEIVDFMEENLYIYKAICRHVVDGDTLDLDMDLGLHQHSHERVRLFGLDTPETYGVKKDSEEYQAGMKAKERVMELVRPADM
ncbi:MAG: thermonuclease family protein, partial [bacterium]